MPYSTPAVSIENASWLASSQEQCCQRCNSLSLIYYLHETSCEQELHEMAERDNLKAALQQVPGLELERPIVFFDLETTGFNAREDRIVELACVRVHPNRQVDLLGGGAVRVNPGTPIPADATRVHNISNADVQHCPGFDTLAPALLDFLAGCDLCGFNIRQLDVHMLSEEFRRCGIDFPAPRTRLLDVCLLFPNRQARKLTSAVVEYLGRQHTAAHSAFGDVLAAMELLKSLLERHGDVLPRTVAGLDDWGCKYHATPCGRLRWRQCPQVQLPGLEVEELFIHDNKFFRCDGTNYHGKKLLDVAATPGFRRAVAELRHLYQPEALEILDRAAAGDDSVCYRIDGVVQADLFNLDDP